MGRNSRVMASVMGSSSSWQIPVGAPAVGVPPPAVGATTTTSTGTSIRLVSGSATSLTEQEEGDEDTLNSANTDDDNLGAGAASAASPDAAPASTISKNNTTDEPIDAAKCGPTDDIDTDDEDMVPMIDDKTGEWGGPTKGGSMPEPTRFGDWERKGRCTDFA